MKELNCLQKRALNVLAEILSPTGEKEKRTTRLLPCPDSDAAPIELGLRELKWAEGWAFDVGCSFASRLDILYSDRKKDGLSKKVWTQGKNFDLSSCSFHGQGNFSGVVIQVKERHGASGEIPPMCLILIYRLDGGKYVLIRQEFVEETELLKMLISGLPAEWLKSD